MDEQELIEAIRGAMEKLDPENDAHWTSEGLPNVAILRDLTGVKSVSRTAALKADPDLRRPVVAKTVDSESETQEIETPVEERDTDPLFDVISKCGDLNIDTNGLSDDGYNEAMRLIGAMAANANALMKRLATEHAKKFPGKPSESLEKVNQENMAHYRKAQAKAREDKAAKIAKMREAGIDAAFIKSLDPRNPVDRPSVKPVG